MKLAFLVGAAVGYTLGARAGRERYEQIVSLGQKVRTSQTVQSTAGVLQAQVDDLAGKVRQIISGQPASSGAGSSNGTNGYRADGYRPRGGTGGYRR